MAEHAERTGSIRQSARDVRESTRGMRRELTPRKVERRLTKEVEQRPLAEHFIDLGVVAKAVLIAAVITLIAALLISLPLGGIALILSFIVAWIVLAKRHYERRRPTREVRQT